MALKFQVLRELQVSNLNTARAVSTPERCAPPTVAQIEGWQASPAKNRRSPTGCRSTFRILYEPGRADAYAPSVNGFNPHAVAEPLM